MKPFLEKAQLHIDDRGSVYCPFDHNGDGDVGLIKRTYIVHNWQKGRIRAWHGHMQGWTGLHVINGVAKIVAVPIGPGFAQRFHKFESAVLSERNPGIFWVPPGWYNGHVSLKDNTKILVYSTHTFEEVKQDDVRMTLSSDDRKIFFEVIDR